MYRNPIHFVCYLEIFFFILYYKPVSHLPPGCDKNQVFLCVCLCIAYCRGHLQVGVQRRQLKLMSYDYQPTVLWQVFSATQFTLNPGNQPFISTRLFNPVIQPSCFLVPSSGQYNKNAYKLQRPASPLIFPSILTPVAPHAS